MASLGGSKLTASLAQGIPRLIKPLMALSILAAPHVTPMSSHKPLTNQLRTASASRKEQKIALPVTDHSDTESH